MYRPVGSQLWVSAATEQAQHQWRRLELELELELEPELEPELELMQGWPVLLALAQRPLLAVWLRGRWHQHLHAVGHSDVQLPPVHAPAGL